jgi:iron-sulfur cluster assembly protein
LLAIPSGSAEGIMLTLTPIASEAIRQLTAQTDDPESSGVRISSGPQTSEGTALELSLVEQPEPTDEKVDDDGATVYLEPHVAGFLEDKVLDAQVDSGRVMFLVRDDDPDGEELASNNGNGPEH